MAIRTVGNFAKGFTYPFRGLRLIFSDWGLLKYSALPFLVNTVLFIIFILLFNTIAYYISDWVFDQTSQEWYWTALSTITGVAMFAVSILAVVFGFAAIGLIVASPFNDMLSAAVERKLTGAVEQEQVRMVAWALRTMKSESKKVMLFLSIQAALLLMNFIPVVGPAMFLVLNPLFISFVMAFEFTGYILDRRGLDFSAKRKLLASNAGINLGFGAAAGITLVIPLLHFLLMPMAVAGATMLVIENVPETGAGDMEKDIIT